MTKSEIGLSLICEGYRILFYLSNFKDTLTQITRNKLVMTGIQSKLRLLLISLYSTFSLVQENVSQILLKHFLLNSKICFPISVSNLFLIVFVKHYK